MNKEYKCSICEPNRYFDTALGLTVHVAKTHKGQDKPKLKYKCIYLHEDDLDILNILSKTGYISDVSSKIREIVNVWINKNINNYVLKTKFIDEIKKIGDEYEK